jgi:hypothetical protein
VEHDARIKPHVSVHIERGLFEVVSCSARRPGAWRWIDAQAQFGHPVQIHISEAPKRPNGSESAEAKGKAVSRNGQQTCI